MTSRRTTRLHECKRCHVKKHAEEMRHPTASRGKAPSTCHQCRTENPGVHWCDHHNTLHPVEAFTRVNRPFPYHNICKDGIEEKASERRDLPPRTCVACHTELPSRSFRGGRVKSPTCRGCQDSNPGKRWCAGCNEFMPDSLFTRTGVDKRFQATRCRPCRTAWAHGVTVAWILNKQGSTHPECASCGSTDDLKVDHDHRCCPTGLGCKKCVRAYLCHQCNTAEGLMVSSDRATLLAAYMRQHGL